MHPLLTATTLLVLATTYVTGDRLTSCWEAKCKVEPAGPSGQQVRGIVRFRQCGHDALTEIGVNLEGFDPSDGVQRHGFHVHQTGSTADGCVAAGGHYNPFNRDHGGPGDAIRHVGDLGNIEEDSAGRVQTVLFDHQVKLSGSQSVINRAIVVHAGTDDLGRGGDEGSRKTGNAGSRLACCVINEIRDENEYDYALCSIDKTTGDPSQRVNGPVWIRQLREGGMTTFSLNLQGFDPYDGERQHGFHVHANPDTSDQCRGAGGHYNPLGALHGGRNSLVRHVGDLGNIPETDWGSAVTSFSDARVSLRGMYSVVNRAIVVHAKRDDLGQGGNTGSTTTGNAGARLGCCIIHKLHFTPQFITSTASYTQTTWLGTSAIWFMGMVHLMYNV